MAEAVKKRLKNLIKNEKYSHYFMSLYFLLACVVVTFLLSSIGWMFDKDGFWKSMEVTFWMFTAPSVVAAIISLLKLLPEDLVYGFSMAMYYGTMAVCGFLGVLGIKGPDDSMIGCSALITGLICYIVYIKKFKDEYKKKDKIDENSREYQVGYQAGFDQGETSGMRFQAMLDNAKSKSTPEQTEAEMEEI